MTRDRRPLAGLLIGHAVSLTGNVLTLIALPLYVLAETGSPAATAPVCEPVSSCGFQPRYSGPMVLDASPVATNWLA